jgi:hypothetical protein
MRLPKWPKEITMLGHTYSVSAKPTVEDENGSEIEGQTNDITKKIEVKIQKNKAEMWSTLIHEMGHAWLRESGLESNMSADMEEMIVISLERHFVPTLLDLVGKGHISHIKASTPATKKGK